MTSRALLCTARAHGRFCGRLSRAVRCMSIGEAPRLLRGAGQGNCVARAAVALTRLPLRAHAASEERLATGLDPAAAALDGHGQVGSRGLPFSYSPRRSLHADAGDTAPDSKSQPSHTQTLWRVLGWSEQLWTASSS